VKKQLSVPSAARPDTTAQQPGGERRPMEDRVAEIVRTRAYYIGQAEGCPDGRSLEHWSRALRELHVVRPNVIGPLSSAESLLTLMSLVHLNKLPPEERIAVSTVQIEALEEWLAACLDPAHMADNDAQAG
jgi:hypothetical protein